MIDAVEIISDPYAEGASEANDRALRLLDLIWNEGYRISGIGGSDTHTAYSESQLGQPVTEVYSIPGSLKSLLKAVKNHNAAVFTDLTGGSLEYQIEGKAVVSGTEINHREDLDLEAVFDPGGCDESFILRIIENGITVDEAVTLPLCKTSVKRKWNGKSDWLRCELRDKNNMIRGYLNPLHRKSCFLTVIRMTAQYRHG